MNLFFKNSSNKVHNLIMEQIESVETCLVSFEAFIQAATTPETPIETLRALAATIDTTEDEADVALRSMIDSLNDSFLPATRENLIAIGTECDKVANKCEELSRKMVTQKFQFPAACYDAVKDILAITHNQFDVLENAIHQMFESFGDLQKDHAILDEIRALESKVDADEQKLYEQIFDMPIGLAERMQTAGFVEVLADISDVIENIADKIQIMLISRKA